MSFFKAGNILSQSKTSQPLARKTQTSETSKNSGNAVFWREMLISQIWAFFIFMPDLQGDLIFGDNVTQISETLI